MIEAVTSISASIDLVKRLSEIGKNIRDAEFLNLLAELNVQLANTKLALASVTEENANLKRRVADLSDRQESTPRLSLKGALYFGQGGEGPFCPACQTSERIAVPLNRQKPPWDRFGDYQCPKCKAHYNS